ncbi:uncharacterized protein [Rhodnius prolixus]|uniref:uncharacterized protein n=1 Tax=Rhodnius prolixus TaxID=13249 RepID=UPI003D187FEF
MPLPAFWFPPKFCSLSFYYNLRCVSISILSRLQCISSIGKKKEQQPPSCILYITHTSFQHQFFSIFICRKECQYAALKISLSHGSHDAECSRRVAGMTKKEGKEAVLFLKLNIGKDRAGFFPPTYW